MLMSSNKPYLIRAMHDWIVDNELTPYIVVDVTVTGVQVPEDYVDDGKIVLNISPEATRGLHIENDRIVFSARFSGVAMQLFVPPKAVLAIYAKENGQGMAFSVEDVKEQEGDGDNSGTPSTSATSSDKPPRKTGKPKLKVIK